MPQAQKGVRTTCLFNFFNLSLCIGAGLATYGPWAGFDEAARSGLWIEKALPPAVPVLGLGS